MTRRVDIHPIDDAQRESQPAVNLNLKQLMDIDTLKVLAAASFSLGATVVVIDWVLKTIIALLTIWYLWRKIHEPKPDEEEDDL